MNQPFTFYEFFAGGGMARAGLGSKWRCVFANDFDAKKSFSYTQNWGGDALKISDISNVSMTDIPATSDLAWASFPCQDLSLAGMGAGLKGDRSGTFWPFWKIIEKLGAENRAPKMIVIENVCGTITSHGGKDFSAICKAFYNERYLFGAFVVDAAEFVPQSRPRLFILGLKQGISKMGPLMMGEIDSKWHTEALVNAYRNLNSKIQSSWIWWKLPYPEKRSANLIDIIEENPASVRWHSAEETKKLIGLMSPANLLKLRNAQKSKKIVIGAVYRRTRVNNEGRKVQRAEIRFDNLAGCLRTPSGGSSRQIIIVVKGKIVKSRLLSSREAARLMGLPDTYLLPEKYNDAYHLLGDGLVVAVVNHISRFLLEPLLIGLDKYHKAA